MLYCKIGSIQQQGPLTWNSRDSIFEMENLKIFFFYRMIYHDLMGDGQTVAGQNF